MKGVKNLKNKAPNIEELYKEKSNIIYKYLLKIGCPKEDAKDIVQDAFFKAIENMIHLNENNVSAWLFKVSINKYYDLCRKQKKRPSVTIEENTLNHLIEEDGASIILKKENKEDIKKVLDELTPLHKNLIILKYDVELSYSQIASMLDMKEETVKTYLYRARNDFKRKWVIKHEKR